MFVPVLVICFPQTHTVTVGNVKRKRRVKLMKYKFSFFISYHSVFTLPSDQLLLGWALRSLYNIIYLLKKFYFSKGNILENHLKIPLKHLSYFRFFCFCMFVRQFEREGIKL